MRACQRRGLVAVPIENIYKLGHAEKSTNRWSETAQLEITPALAHGGVTSMISPRPALSIYGTFARFKRIFL